MKRWIGQFIFNFVVRYIDYLDDPTYDHLITKVYRPEFARKRLLPKPDGRLMMFRYTKIH